MKTCCLVLLLIWSPAAFAAEALAPVSPPTETSAAPPSAAPKRSAAELEKLVASIALYPDPLIATLLPASVYPLEIVQAARFVANTNNLAKLDEQPWDDSVKAVARVPELIQKMNEDISWTIELGEAFLAQDKDVMDAIQSMRGKAQKAGTLQTSPQQVVTVTNMVVEKTVEQQVVVVTNTVVQIQPSNPQVVYVPTYNPSVVYYPPPAYVYNPVAPLVTFGAGMAMGAIIANNCDWHHGGCYHGDVDINVNRTANVNQNVNTVTARTTSASGARASSTSAPKKWQPDQSRLNKSGAPSVASSARSPEARGWGAGGAKPSTGNVGVRPSTGNVGARPSTGMPSANRSTASPSVSRPNPSASVSQTRSSPSASRSSSPGSAFAGTSSGASARDFSSRGSSSRSGGGGGGRGGGGGGGGRGGGRR